MELTWTRDESGNYNSDVGNWKIVKTPGRRFKLHRVSDISIDPIMTGSLKQCQDRANQAQDVLEEEAVRAQAERDAQMTKVEENKTAMRGWDSTATPATVSVDEQEIHRFADDGCPHHDHPPVRRNITQGGGCKCNEIDFGQTCPTHGRKLRGGVGNSIPFVFLG